jgi:hypothetical protein
VRSLAAEATYVARNGELEYRYPVDRLLNGASFGNPETFLKLTPQSDVAGLWSALDDQEYCGRWITHVFIGGERAQPRETVFRAAYQETAYICGRLAMRKRTFLPMRGDHMQVVYMQVTIENPTDEPYDAAVMCDVHYPAFVWPGMYKVPDQDQRAKRVETREQNHVMVSATRGRDREVRVFASDAEVAATYAGDRGFSRTFRAHVPPRASATVSLRMAISNRGDRAALSALRKSPAADVALAQAEAFYEDVAHSAIIMTPDPVINRAYQWAKINTVRVQHRFPAGWGFTNDPSQDIVVVRDAAWYATGSDYVTPQFTREMLDLVAEHGIEEGGKITEYILAAADPPTSADYDLNINDDTPLIVGAVYHHYALTGDREVLERYWPMVRGACDWILKQIVDGLVYSHSQEANVWGIAGWRNIIPQSQISGFVTEINSECAHALRVGARLAQDAGDGERAERYLLSSERLTDEINRRLISDRHGFYLLNIDPEGVAHHDLTGDQIFPVLFGVASNDRKRAVLDLLYTSNFWTPFGVRTVARGQETYDPDYGLQLLGGVWPNLTAWVAYSSKTYSPRKLVAGMRNIWKISEVENPRAYQNVVPGLFPERLSGETYKSRGMTMSPWMPPTYVWLAFEGLLGFEPTADGLRVNPHLPSDWKWVGARNAGVRGEKLSCFYHRRVLYSTLPVMSRSKTVVLPDDVTEHVESDAPFVLALRNHERTLLFVGTDEPGTYRVTIKPPLVFEPERHEIELRAGDARMLELRKKRR